MAASYDEAVAELYRSAHDAFVAERKRLAGELKAAGDKAGAARLSKLGRPSISAWAVNQLWWHAREPFERLFAAAARLRAGDQGGASERRDALASLKSRAAALLVESGHAVSEGTLRRVTTTLSALAAGGGFEPDLPGALAADRDPPGFDAATMGGLAGAPVPVPAAPKPAPEGPARASTREQAPVAAPRAPAEHAENAERERAQRERAARENAERERESAEREREEKARLEREREERELSERLRAEQRRVEVERAARRAEHERLQASLPLLQSDLERREREVERLRAELARVQGLAEQARVSIQAAEKRLSELAASNE